MLTITDHDYWLLRNHYQPSSAITIALIIIDHDSIILNYHQQALLTLYIINHWSTVINHQSTFNSHCSTIINYHQSSCTITQPFSTHQLIINNHNHCPSSIIVAHHPLLLNHEQLSSVIIHYYSTITFLVFQGALPCKCTPGPGWWVHTSLNAF